MGLGRELAPKLAQDSEPNFDTDSTALRGSFIAAIGSSMAEYSAVGACHLIAAGCRAVEPPTCPFMLFAEMPPWLESAGQRSTCFATARACARNIDETTFVPAGPTEDPQPPSLAAVTLDARVFRFCGSRAGVVAESQAFGPTISTVTLGTIAVGT